MSRGLGKVQQKILECLKKERGKMGHIHFVMDTPYMAFDIPDMERFTDAQYQSCMRSIRGLKQAGLIITKRYLTNWLDRSSNSGGNNYTLYLCLPEYEKDFELIDKIRKQK